MATISIHADAGAFFRLATAATSAATATVSYAEARRNAARATDFHAQALARLQREAAGAGGMTVIPGAGDMEAMAQAARNGATGDLAHSGGFIIAAYAEQFVTAYAALLMVMATPNVSPFAYNEANASTTRMAMYWQLLGFNKYGNLESLARAKMRGDSGGSPKRIAGKQPTPGAKPQQTTQQTIAQQQATGALRR